MNMATSITTQRQSLDQPERIAVAAGAALLAAGLILVLFILPAEFAVDPLGIGARLGLMQLGATGKQIEAFTANTGTADGQTPVVVAQDHEFREETVSFTIAPREFMEYKYRLEKGKSLLYSWKATAPVNYELHAEPDGAPRGFAETYEKAPATSDA